MPMFQELSGAEWRDPEGASFAIAASRRSYRTTDRLQVGGKKERFNQVRRNSLFPVPAVAL
jgi:hypothetical protein